LTILAGCGPASPSTTLKLYGGTDYDLANSAIIEPYFSMAKAPYGFPLDEAKWRVESLMTTNSSQASPTASTWYNKGRSLAVPIWSLEGGVCGGAGGYEDRGGRAGCLRDVVHGGQLGGE
jgi:hypothetical protein